MRRDLSLGKRIAQVMLPLCLTAILIVLPIDWDRFSSAGYAGVFIANLVGSSAIIAHLPVGLVIVAAGKVLNPLVVAAVSGFGSGLGEFTAYWVGCGGSLVLERQRDRIARPLQWVRQWGPLAVFALALVPSPFYDFAGIAAGLVRMNIFNFFIATSLGRFIKAYLLATAGNLLFAQALL